MVKKYLIIFVAFLIGLIGLIIIYQKVGVKDVLEQLLRLRYWQVLLVLLTAIIMITLTTTRWGLLARDIIGTRLPIKTIIKARLGELAVSYLTPVMYFGGEWVRAYVLNKDKDVPINKGLVSVLLDRISELVASFLFMLAGAVFLVLEKSFIWGILMLVLSAIVFLTLYLFIFLIGLDRVLFFIVKVFGLNRLKYNSKEGGSTTVGERIIFLGHQIDDYLRHHSAKFYFTVFISFVSLLIWLWQTKLIINFLGFYLPLSKIFIIKMFITLSGFIPIPANLGSYEGAHLLVFGIFGLPADSAVALSVVNRGIDLIWVSAGIFLISHFLVELMVKIPKLIFNINKNGEPGS